jgi:hypothetical protein
LERSPEFAGGRIAYPVKLIPIEKEPLLMSLISRRRGALAAIAASALLAAACGGGSKSSTIANGTNSTGTTSESTVIGQSTTVVFYPSMATALKNGAITVAPVPPSTAKGSVLMFTISGGQIVTATFSGTLNHTGGLTFSHNGKSVKLTDFVLNTQTKQLTATLNGKSLPMFDLNLASVKRAAEPKRTYIATNIQLTVTSNSASALNDGLGVTTFKAGQNFGVATVVLKLNS